MRLKNKICLITGSSRGIGKKIAQSFSAEGAYVIITYNKNRVEANKLSKKLKNMIPPRWVFITGQTHLKSSTQLRLEKIGLKKKY